jgi:NTE family protein
MLSERLRGLPLFADLNDDQLDRLASCTSEFDAPAGQALIERGRPGSGLFVLEEGRAVVEAPEGQRELEPGDVFGERALLGEDIERTARVRARTDVKCLAIARTELEQVLEESPSVAARLRQLSA